MTGFFFFQLVNKAVILSMRSEVEGSAFAFASISRIQASHGSTYTLSNRCALIGLRSPQ
jgi:hypothetical protein